MKRGLSSAALSRLGHEPDAAIARDEDVSAYTVRNTRQKLGIPAYREDKSRRKIPWEHVVSRMGVDSDHQIARDLGVTPTAVALQREKRGIPPIPDNAEVRWTPEMLARLVDMSDREVAKRFGISVQTVSTKRRDLGITKKGSRYFGITLSKGDYGLLKVLAQRLRHDLVVAPYLGDPPSLGKVAGLAMRYALASPDNSGIRAAASLAATETHDPPIE